MAMLVAIDVGGTSAKLALVDAETGRIAKRASIPTPPREHAGEAFLDAVGQAAEHLAASSPIAAIGVSLCELISPQGEIESGHRVPWTTEAVHDRLGRIAPVRIEADVRAAALAEARLGVADGAVVVQLGVPEAVGLVDRDAALLLGGGVVVAELLRGVRRRDALARLVDARGGDVAREDRLAVLGVDAGLDLLGHVAAHLGQGGGEARGAVVATGVEILAAVALGHPPAVRVAEAFGVGCRGAARSRAVRLHAARDAEPGEQGGDEERGGPDDDGRHVRKNMEPQNSRGALTLRSRRRDEVEGPNLQRFSAHNACDMHPSRRAEGEGKGSRRQVLERDSERHDEWNAVMACRPHVRSMLLSQDVSLHSLAARLGLKPVLLQRRLDIVGISFRDLVTRVRLEILGEAIRQDETSPDLMLSLGFSRPNVMKRFLQQHADEIATIVRQSRAG